MNCAKMKLALHIDNPQLREREDFVSLCAALRERGCELYDAESVLEDGTDFLLSVGGDGTFLSASRIAAGTSVPVLGVNLGRLGFLSEHSPEDILSTFLDGRYTIERREMLHAKVNGVQDGNYFPYALNEITVHRIGAAMLGVDVTLDGEALPTYWADGLLVATSSGSTAYSLSVGGPICTPDSKVIIIAPISPHNLNLRPLIVPSDSEVHISMRSRDDQVMLTMDNRNMIVSPDSSIDISLAQFSLNRVRLGKKNFIGALKSKLFWGEDVRNESE